MLRLILSVALFCCCLAFTSTTQAVQKRAGAFISTPKEGGSVGRKAELSGKTFLRGQPLILVRAVDGNGQWWVQRTIQRNDRGQLKGTVQFGNELTEPGTKFAVVVVVVQTPLELEFFTKRESLAELPNTVPKSEIRNVVLGKPVPSADKNATKKKDAHKKPGDNDDKNTKPGPDPKPAGNGDKPNEPTTDDPSAAKPSVPKATSPTGTDAGKPKANKSKSGDKGKPSKIGLAILKPLDNASVSRFTELVGRMESADKPVVLVPPEGGDGHWWVQDKVVFGEGKYFKTKLRFGNDKTPPGTRFMVLIVSPTPGAQAEAMKPGANFPALPRGIRRSKEVIVKLAPEGFQGAK